MSESTFDIKRTTSKTKKSKSSKTNKKESNIKNGLFINNQRNIKNSINWINSKKKYITFR